MKKAIEVLKIIWTELTRKLTDDETVELEAYTEGRIDL